MKSPLIATTQNEEGDEISLLGGGPINTPGTQSTVILMTPDGLGGFKPIPRLVDNFIVDNPGDVAALGVPEDGASLIIKENGYTTAGITPQTDGAYGRIYLKTGLDVDTIVGGMIFTFATINMGTYTGPAMMIITADLTILQEGLTGPGIIIVLDSDNDGDVYIKSSIPQTGSMGSVLAGWNKVVWDNEDEDYVITQILESTIPAMSNAYVSDYQSNTTAQYVSTEPWVISPVKKYAVDGIWKTDEKPVVKPPAYYIGRGTDDEVVSTVTKAMNMYTMNCGLYAPATLLDYCKIYSWALIDSDISMMKMPHDTGDTPEDIAAAYGVLFTSWFEGQIGWFEGQIGDHGVVVSLTPYPSSGAEAFIVTYTVTGTGTTWSEGIHRTITAVWEEEI